MKHILIIISLMFVGCVAHYEEAKEPKRYQIDSRVVIVKSIGGEGAGLLIGDKVITCNHVTDSGVLSVEYADGTTGTATLIKASKEHDLALLQVSNAHGSRPIKWGFRPPPGTPTHTIGHPVAGNYSYTEGEIASPSMTHGKSYRTLCRMKVDFGHSGGPVFTNTNTFVGIVSAMYPGTDYTLVVPAHVVWTFMNSP